MKNIVLPILLVLVSCANMQREFASTYTVKVDAVSEPGFSTGKSFKIVPAFQDESKLVFKQYAEIAKKALEESEFKYKEKNPDLVIKLSYEISHPNVHTETKVKQKYGLNKTSVRNQYGQEVGTLQNWGSQGYDVHTETSETYMRRVVLQAFHKGKEVWYVKMLSEGSSGDLKHVYPYIIKAGIPFYGLTNNHTVEVKDHDSELSYLRKPAAVE